MRTIEIILIIEYYTDAEGLSFQLSGCPRGHCKVCYEARKIRFVPQNPCNAQCCDYSKVVITIKKPAAGSYQPDH